MVQMEVNCAEQEASLTSLQILRAKCIELKGGNQGSLDLEGLLVQGYKAGQTKRRAGKIQHAQQSCPMLGPKASAPAGNGFKYECLGLTPDLLNQKL